MYYAMVIFPDMDPKPINRIRAKYDPTLKLIEPHIPVLFPVPESVATRMLRRCRPCAISNAP